LFALRAGKEVNVSFTYVPSLLSPHIKDLTAKNPSPHSPDSIFTDLTTEKPLYPLSSYGPGKSTPCIISNQDESPEELRVRAWRAKNGGGINMAGYMDYERGKIESVGKVIMVSGLTKCMFLF
jgi:hypothetical protein